VVWTTGLSGGNRAIFEIANRLGGKGYKVEIIALGGDHTWFDVKVPVYYIQPPKPIKRLLLLYRILRARRKKRYYAITLETVAKRLGFYADLVKFLSEHIPKDLDVSIATFYPTALSLYLSGVGDRKLYFLQDFPELVEEYEGTYGLKLFEVTLKLPFDYFLCNSSYTENIVKKTNPTANTIVTGVGVDTSVFRPQYKGMIYVKDSRKKVMVIIRGQRFKGDEIAINALNLISTKVPIHAIIVGSRKAIAELFTKVKPSFTYDIFERVSDETLAKIYSSADVFLYTSYAESFGLPPLEAMACGTPVVTTDNKGNRDYIREGYNCLIIPPGSPEAAANAVIKILQDDKLRDRLIEGGLETARHWTWDKVVGKFEYALKSN